MNCRSGIKTLGDIVMKACEESLLPMLWDTHIEQLISGIVDAKSGDEAALVAKMRNKLEGLPQSFFGIPEMYNSPGSRFWHPRTFRSSSKTDIGVTQ